MTASALPPGRLVDLYVAGERIAQALTDEQGALLERLLVPANAAVGVPIWLHVPGTAHNAACPMLIEQTPRAPSLSTPLAPATGAFGWNNGPVTVTLAAIDLPEARGIESITYAITGAEMQSAVTVPGAPLRKLDAAMAEDLYRQLARRARPSTRTATRSPRRRRFSAGA